MNISAVNARRMALLWILAMAAGYLLQLASPLRVNVDSYRHLAMATSAAEGQGFLVEGKRDLPPPGYSVLLLALLKAGWANPAVIILVNLVSIAAAAFASHYMLRKAGFTQLFTALVLAATLSSWVLVKYATMPQSDVAYLGASWLALLGLWLFWEARGARRWAWFVAAVVVATISITIRTCGLAFVPTLVLAATRHRDSQDGLRSLANRKGRRAATALVVAAVALGIAVIAGLSRTRWCDAQLLGSESYLQRFAARFGRLGTASLVTTGIRYRLYEFGEVFLNLPVNKVLQLAVLLPVAGVLAWVAVLRGWWVTRNRLFPLNLYFLAYCAILICWPRRSSRFWLPLLPILLTYAFAALAPLCARARVLRGACAMYLAGFLALGCVAMLFSTRISLAGKDFSERYGTEKPRMTYRYAHDNGKPVALDRVIPGYLKVLGVFDPRTSKGVADLENDRRRAEAK